MNNKKHQENKVIILLITAVSTVLVTWLFVVVVLGSQLANNASAQTLTNQSDTSMVEKQHDDANNMSNYTGNKTTTPITEINSTEIGIATPTTDSIK
jgi:hypothetical protein